MAENKKHNGYIALAEAILRQNEHDYIYGNKWQREAILRQNIKNIIRDIVEFTGMDINDYNNNLIRRGVEYDQRIHTGRAADPSGQSDRGRL